MYVGRLRHERRLVVDQAILVWATANKATASDLQRYIQRGELGGGQTRAPYMPEVEAEVARINANGGKFVMPEKPSGVPQ